MCSKAKRRLTSRKRSQNRRSPSSLGVVTAATAATGAPLSQSPALFDNVAAGEAGIWVTGTGQITMEPDLAILNLGVETIEMTVAEANGAAATAMDAIMQSLMENGVGGAGHTDSQLQRTTAV